MPISPEEITSKRFLVALRGYDKDQVDSFLKELAREIQDLRLSGMAGDEESFHELGRQVVAIARSASAEARRIRERAESDAAAIVGKAEEEVSELRQAFDHGLAMERAAWDRELQTRQAAIEEARAAAQRESEELLASAREAANAAKGRAEQDARSLRADAYERVKFVRQAMRETLEELGLLPPAGVPGKGVDGKPLPPV